MKLLCRRLRSRLAEEGGAALVVVLALSLTMLILIAAGLSFSLSGMKVADKDADRTAALAAAYAGVDEYSSRLSNDSRYQRFGNPAAPFTIATGSALSVSLPAAGQENPAFGVGETGTWAEIAGTDGRASFRYEVDNSLYSSQGTLRVRSTGRVGDQTQTVVADLRQSGFIDFLYYTTYEIMDPSLWDSRCVPDYAYVNYSGDVTHANHCLEIEFGNNDVLNGPVHSNDTMRICGAEFNGKVTSSSDLGLTNNYNKSGYSCTPSFASGSGPAYAPKIGMPPTNDALRKEARLDVPDVTRPGCMYTGPTTITFLANGTVNVISPWTKFTNPSLTAGIASENRAVCGVIGELNSPGGATFTVPEQNLIWVQSVPENATDPNYTASGRANAPDYFDCSGSGADVGWKYDSIEYPLDDERIPDSSTSVSPAYGCRNGDAFVKGVVHGQVSVASDNFIYITGDITYADKALDILGLMGNNAVWVWNPVEKDYYKSRQYAMLGDYDRTIYAAILSVNHTFQVQNYDRGGDRGELKVVGAIAQFFRGTVALPPNGYDKNYNYDDRLFSISPPKFLTPTSTTYGVTKYALVPNAFSASGATN